MKFTTHELSVYQAVSNFLQTLDRRGTFQRIAQQGFGTFVGVNFSEEQMSHAVLTFSYS